MGCRAARAPAAKANNTDAVAVDARAAQASLGAALLRIRPTGLSLREQSGFEVFRAALLPLLPPAPNGEGIYDDNNTTIAFEGAVCAALRALRAAYLREGVRGFGDHLAAFAKGLGGAAPPPLPVSPAALAELMLAAAAAVAARAAGARFPAPMHGNAIDQFIH